MEAQHPGAGPSRKPRLPDSSRRSLVSSGTLLPPTPAMPGSKGVVPAPPPRSGPRRLTRGRRRSTASPSYASLAPKRTTAPDSRQPRRAGDGRRSRRSRGRGEQGRAGGAGAASGRRGGQGGVCVPAGGGSWGGSAGAGGAESAFLGAGGAGASWGPRGGRRRVGAPADAGRRGGVGAPAGWRGGRGRRTWGRGQSPSSQTRAGLVGPHPGPGAQPQGGVAGPCGRSFLSPRGARVISGQPGDAWQACGGGDGGPPVAGSARERLASLLPSAVGAFQTPGPGRLGEGGRRGPCI